MIVLGLTGSVAMGKTTISKIFVEERIAVHDADATVHKLMEKKGKAYKEVTKAFPKSVDDTGAIDRKHLANIIFTDPDKRVLLESILHPLVAEDRKAWLGSRRANGDKVVVFDIPLLYEVGSDKECDMVAVVSASAYQQKRRALARGMSEAQFDSITAAQIPDSEKRQRADFIIPTAFGITASRWYVHKILEELTCVK